MFDPDDPRWSEGDEGEFWRYQGVSSGIPWRCTLRWLEGGWTQLVGLEFGAVVVEEPNLIFDRKGRAKGVDQRGNPVYFRELSPGPVKRAVDDLFHSLRDAEVGATLAAVMRADERGWDAPDRTPRVQAVLDKIGASTGVLHDVGLAAAVYAMFVRRGSANPTEATAQALHMSRATAARRIKQARERGLLGPARSGRASADSGEVGM